jgi:hypothetical protein
MLDIPHSGFEPSDSAGPRAEPDSWTRVWMSQPEEESRRIGAALVSNKASSACGVGGAEKR